MPLNKVNYRKSFNTKEELGKSVGSWKNYQTEINQNFDATKPYFVVMQGNQMVLDFDIITPEKLKKKKKLQKSISPEYQKRINAGEVFNIEKDLKEFLSLYGLNESYIVKTQSGGYHYYCEREGPSLGQTQSARTWKYMDFDTRAGGKGIVFGEGTTLANGNAYSKFSGDENKLASVESWRIAWALNQLEEPICKVNIGEFLDGQVNPHDFTENSANREFILYRETMFKLKEMGYTQTECLKALSGTASFHPDKCEAQITSWWNKEDDPNRVRATGPKVIKKSKNKTHLTIENMRQEYDESAELLINGNLLKGEAYWNEIGKWLDADGELILPSICMFNKKNPEGMMFDGEWLAISFWLDHNIEGIQQMLYCQLSETWLMYNARTHIWKRVKDNYVESVITSYAKAKLGSARQPKVIRSYRVFMENWNPYQSNQPIVNLQSSKLIPFKNICYSWEEKQFRQAKIDDFILSYIPYEYNADATCPMIESCVDQIVNQDPTNKMLFIDGIYAYMSSLLQGYNVREWILMLVSQQGGVGKGTLKKIMIQLLGRQNVVEVSDKTLAKPSARDCMVGKRLYIMSETGDEIEGLTTIKRISGGDYIDIDPKYKSPYDYLPFGQMLILTNNKIKFDPKEVAFWRRPLLVKMVDLPIWKPEIYEKNLEIMLSDGEIQGLLVKLIGYIDRQVEIKQKYHKTIDAQSLWEDSIQNTEYEFFDSCLKREMDSTVMCGDLVANYKEWMLAYGIDEKPEHKKTMYVRKFNKMLAGWARNNRMFDVVKGTTNKGAVWKNISFDSSSYFELIIEILGEDPTQN